MATVPNYYYNSPWIADVGRNLASALAPPDPDKLLARQANEFNLQNAQTTAANTAADRANTERSRVAVGKMYDLQRSPVIGADGKPDREATEREAFRLADEAMHYGPKDVRAEVDDALFNLSPTFARKKILQRVAIDAQSDRLSRSLAGAIDQLRVGGAIKGGLQDDQQEFELQRLDKLYGLRWNELKFKSEQAAKGLGKPPLTISKPLGQEILMGLLRREKATRNPLTDEARFAMLAEISQDTQQTRDPYFSTQRIWSKHFPNARYADAATQEVQEPGMFDNWFGNTDTFLAPLGPNGPAAIPGAPPPGAEPAVAEAPASLGGAVTTPPVNPFLRRGQDEAEMEALSRAAAQAENEKLPLPTEKTPRQPPAAAKGKKPKEGDRQKSKKGLPMIFHNGRWEYE